MCRLMALTFTDRPLRRFKADILDRMLLMSQTDDGQNDGWGITDGRRIIKHNAMYSVSLPDWKPELDPSLAWLAHIRKASTTTGRGINESHPYEFIMENGESLFAAHNGFIHGTNWNIDRRADVKGAPNTDSWRAFCQLWLDMLETEKVDGVVDLIPHLFQEWTPNFEDNSQFAMLFHWRGNVIALRHDRPLHCMRFGNGHIVHTSLEFLKILRANLKWQYNVEAEDPKYIDKDNMVIFRPGDENTTVEKLDLKFKPRPVYNNTGTAWQGHGGSQAGNAQTTTNNTTSPSANSGVSGSSSAPSGNSENKDIYSKPVTKSRPRGAVTSPDKEDSQQRPVLLLPDGSAYVIKKKDEDRIKDALLPTKAALWRTMLKDFISLRNAMCTFWATTALGYKEVAPGEFLTTASLADLRLFQTMVCKTIPIFTKRQNILINAWNHLVNRDNERILHAMWCDQAFFWMNPRYNRTNDEDHDAVARFQADLIGFVLHMELDPRRYLKFDEEKLQDILDQSSRIRTIHMGAD